MKKTIIAATTLALCLSVASAFSIPDLSGILPIGPVRFITPVLGCSESALTLIDRVLAEQIKKDLSQAGISSYILSVPFNEYQQRISQKSYDLFIGEIQFSQNQDITSFISGQENMFGAYKEELFYALEDAKKLAKTDDIKGAYSIICGKLSENMPVIGLYFENDYLLVNNRINGNIQPNISNIFSK